MEDFILQEKKYLVEVLGKKLIDSDERDDRRYGYQNLAKKYWPEEFKNGIKKEVHHIDFNHYNNVVSNLVVLTRSEHAKIHSLFDPNYEETRQKLREIHLGENNPMFGVPSPMKDKHHSEEICKQISKAFLGKHWKVVNGKRVWY